MTSLLLIAARSLMQHKRRTLLLGVAIAGVTGLLVVLTGLANGIRATMLESAITLMSGHVNVGGFYKVTPSQAAPVVTDYPKILEVVRRDVPELDFVVERGRGGGKLITETGSVQVVLAGVEIAKEQGLHRVLHILEGSLDELAQPNTIALFPEQAKKLDVKVGDTLTISAYSPRGTSNVLDLRVVAIAQSMGLFSNFSVFVSSSTLRSVHQLSEGTTGALHLYLKDIRQANAVQARLYKSLADAGYTLLEPNPQAFFMKFDGVNREDWTGQRLDVTTWEEEISFMQYILQALEALTGVLTLILLVVIAVGIMNTMWISIRERTREIGTLRAIGMQRGSVLGMFVLEAFLLGLSSTVTGALLGVLFCGAVNSAHVGVDEALGIFLMRDTLTLKVDPLATLKAIALITGCTTAISLIPSFLAARLKPVTAMHHVG